MTAHDPLGLSRASLLVFAFSTLGCAGAQRREVAPVGETVDAARGPGTTPNGDTGADASPPPGPPREQPTPPALVAAITQSALIGERVHRHDTWAATATDNWLARTGGRPEAGIGGWVVEERGSGAIVHFVRGTATSAVRVSFPGADDRGATLETGDAPLPSPLQRAFRARLTASASDFPKLSRSYNPVVLPGSLRGEPGFLVYLLAATSSPNEMILGGHSRVSVTEDGGTVTAIVPLSKTIIRLPKQPPGAARSVAVFVTHLLTETPTETHVAASLEYRIPIMVGTSVGLWQVAGTKITFFGKPPSSNGP